MSFHGGFLGVLVAMALFARQHKLSWLQLMDFIAPLVPLGLGAGRIGNFINAELWGRPTTVAWGMVFPNVDDLPRHPSQLYEFALEGLALFALMWLYSRKPRPVGAVSGFVQPSPAAQREPQAFSGRRSRERESARECAKKATCSRRCDCDYPHLTGGLVLNGTRIMTPETIFRQHGACLRRACSPVHDQEKPLHADKPRGGEMRSKPANSGPEHSSTETSSVVGCDTSRAEVYDSTLNLVPFDTRPTVRWG